jgi:precorrin-6B methylase 1
MLTNKANCVLGFKRQLRQAKPIMHAACTLPPTSNNVRNQLGCSQAHKGTNKYQSQAPSFKH